MRARARQILARVIERLNAVVPKRPHAVVYGLPWTEGNAVEVIRQLGSRYRGRVYWLDGPDDAGRFGRDVRPLRRLSVRGLARYLTAELVLYTHGLYGDPAPSRRQTMVNLWHGDGIKANLAAARRRRSLHPSTYIVGSTRVLTEQKARDFHLPPGAALVTGNPRTDQFFVPSDAGALRRLGLDDGRPFVIWLPTFRKAGPTGVLEGWADVAATTGVDLNERIRGGVDVLRESGLTVVVKRHPLDAEARDVPGAVVVEDEDLASAGIPLYGLLGRSAGLITDYSSAWTDYLLLDRPIGFFIPDRDDYAESRGLYPPDALTWLPGPELDTPQSFRAFAAEVIAGETTWAPARRQAAERLGLNRTRSAARDLLDELERRGALRKTRTFRVGER
jgi:CDP-glycerol glycerophosphotransferase